MKGHIRSRRKSKPSVARATWHAGSAISTRSPSASWACSPPTGSSADRRRHRLALEYERFVDFFPDRRMRFMNHGYTEEGEAPFAWATTRIRNPTPRT